MCWNLSKCADSVLQVARTKGERSAWARVFRSWRRVVTQKTLVEQKDRRIEIGRIDGNFYLSFEKGLFWVNIIYNSIKNRKYLGINLTKEVQNLYAENL